MKRLKRFTIKFGDYSIRFQKSDYETDMKPNRIRKILGITLSWFST